jgi:hypothetical protein
VALPLLPATRNAAYVIDAGGAEPVCTSDAPRVCVTRAHADALESVTGSARDALRRLAPLASAPTSVTESTLKPSDHNVKPQPSEVVTLDLYPAELDEQSQPTVSGEKLTTRILEGAGTTECTALPAKGQRTREAMERLDREFAARELAASLLFGKPVVAFDARMAQAWPALHALPAEEKLRRLSALRLALLSCQGDPLDILTQGVSR